MAQNFWRPECPRPMGLAAKTEHRLTSKNLVLMDDENLTLASGHDSDEQDMTMCDPKPCCLSFSKMIPPTLQTAHTFQQNLLQLLQVENTFPAPVWGSSASKQSLSSLLSLVSGFEVSEVSDSVPTSPSLSDVSCSHQGLQPTSFANEELRPISSGSASTGTGLGSGAVSGFFP